MAEVTRIAGVERLIAKLRDKAAAARRDSDASVIVGYSASYALFVHENVEMKLRGQPRRAPGKGRYWDPQGRGQAKFLEQPARELAVELGRIIRGAIRGGATLATALVAAGMRLQRESMLLVPVDTGNLKASAFTRLE